MGVRYVTYVCICVCDMGVAVCIYVHVCVFVCLYVYVQCLQRSQEAIGSLGAGVIEGCELPFMCCVLGIEPMSSQRIGIALMNDIIYIALNACDLIPVTCRPYVPFPNGC